VKYILIGTTISFRLRFYHVDVNAVPYRLVSRAGVTVSLLYESVSVRCLDCCLVDLTTTCSMFGTLGDAENADDSGFFLSFPISRNL